MKQIIRFSDALKATSHNPFHLMIKPAGPACNLNCTYCYYIEKSKLFPGKKVMNMTSELLESSISQFIGSHQTPEVSFTWQGGEPTLVGLGFFRKAIELQRKYAGDKRIENAFQTNGTRLNDDWCKFFVDNNILVGISIDGEEHNHDHFRKTFSGGPTFKSVMKGIELLHSHKVEFNTLSTVNSYNVRFATETYRFLKKIGSGFIQFLPVVERVAEEIRDDEFSLLAPVHLQKTKVTDWSVSAKDYGTFLIKIFDEWVRHDVAGYFVQIFDATLANYIGENPGLCVFSETCGDALVMEHNGDLFSCDHFVYPEYMLGNILTSGLADLARSQQQFDFGIEKRNTLPPFCQQCDVLYACNGECPKHRFIKTPDGSPGLNYLCEGYKEFFTHVEPYMKFMADELKNKRPPANVMTWVRNKENTVLKQPVPERNASCPCGSGKKYKNCCAAKTMLRDF